MSSVIPTLTGIRIEDCLILDIARAHSSIGIAQIDATRDTPPGSGAKIPTAYGLRAAAGYV